MCSGRLVWIVEARMSYGAQSAPPLFSLVNQILLSGLVSHSCPCVDQKVSLIMSWCSWVINEASPPFVRLAGKYSTQVFFFFFFPVHIDFSILSLSIYCLSRMYLFFPGLLVSANSLSFGSHASFLDLPLGAWLLSSWVLHSWIPDPFWNREWHSILSWQTFTSLSEKKESGRCLWKSRTQNGNDRVSQTVRK